MSALPRAPAFRGRLGGPEFAADPHRAGRNHGDQPGLKLLGLVTRALAERLRQRPLQFLVFDLITRPQRRIVALELRHRDRFARFELPGQRGNRVLRGSQHGFAGGPGSDRGNQRRCALLLPGKNHVFLNSK